MKISSLAGGPPIGVVTWEKALTNPKVLSLARELNIDLNNEGQRNAVLEQAEKNNEYSSVRKAALPEMDSGMSVFASHPEFTRHYVQSALQLYREISAL